MGQRTQYSPGTFSWTDLSTTDQDAAKAFYGGLFGWTAVDNPVDDQGTVYSMMQLDGKDVAAISKQPEMQRDAGAPPMWNSYITVESADAALEKAKELGGTAHAPAFDVMDVGRMAVVQDPQGAYFLLWEPKLHTGAGLVNGHGLLTWNELASPDIDASASFYGGLFGWTANQMEGSEMPYRIINTADGHGNGGIREQMPMEPMPYWLVYFGTDDIDATLAKISELGGNVLVPASPIGVGSIAVAQDPQGAVFALFAGEFEE